MQQNNAWETIQWKKPRKWNVINNLSKSQVFVAHSFWVICRNISCTLVELCMEMLYWFTVLVHQYGCRKSTKHLEFTFSIKALSFHWETSICAHKHILEMVMLLKIKRRLFQQDSIPILVSSTVKTQKFKLLYFRNETCYGTGDLFKRMVKLNKKTCISSQHFSLIVFLLPQSPY